MYFCIECSSNESFRKFWNCGNSGREFYSHIVDTTHQTCSLSWNLSEMSSSAETENKGDTKGDARTSRLKMRKTNEEVLRKRLQSEAVRLLVMFICFFLLIRNCD